MHDGPFLGLQGVHRAEIVGIGPDGRALVLIPTLGATPLFAQSLVPVPTLPGPWMTTARSARSTCRAASRAECTVTAS